MLCLIKANTNTIDLTVHTSWYCILDLLCVNLLIRSTIYTTVPKFLLFICTEIKKYCAY